MFTDFKRYYSLKDRISNILPSSLSLCGKSMHPPPSCGGVVVTGSDQWSGLEALGLDSRPGIHQLCAASNTVLLISPDLGWVFWE